jgi:hypothetical protein
MDFGVGEVTGLRQAIELSPQVRPARMTALSGDVAEQSVPADVAARLEPVLGVDTSTVVVRRGPAVDRAAAALGARGFTVGDVPHVPDFMGALDDGPGAAVLAHELGHVVQQRRGVASSQPEDEALAVEDWFAGGAPAPASHSPGGGSLPHVQLAAGETVPVHDVGTVPVHDAGTAEERFLSWLATVRDMPPPGGAAAGEPPTSGAVTGEPAPDPRGEPLPRWMDLDDVDHFVEISNRIYNELSARLRFDLIVERERSGSLMDRN